MRKTLSVAVLVLAFCSPVAAGIIHNPEPQPTPTNTTQETTSTDEDTGATDTLTQIVLTVLVSVLP